MLATYPSSDAPKPSIKSSSTEMPLLMLLSQNCKNRLNTDKKKSPRKWHTPERFFKV